ncbi:protein involved in meta-pathway of phenol degradation [Croceivirga radicis]|uniref:Protein involved in meta-pathway of phenol degradation n=1 Tax=Croceivirga radicis TaxID=1929488 RepID=A0A1V6LN50_9FLAO|nr:protein involved in meta-pathway of phenol degradation [Croceivirga radicis]OQD41624.1 protein involved in meta-pathway of phenol degradation [Croceivirga radicis]
MKTATSQTTLFLLLIIFNFQLINAQGCVAIRHFSSCVGNALENNLLGPGDIQIGSNYRYFKSFRHFRGTEEEADRVANETEVVNNAHAWDFFITYGITDRLYASATLPFVINTRSSLYEHGRNERNTTFSRGLADVRLGVGYWVFNPANNPNGNLALGLGVKLPTGNYNASDIFYNVGPEGSPQVRPVDQSIQPGDGGFGITLDFQLYKKIFTDFYLYAGGFYLINPRETNGTRTLRETLSPILENEAIMAVPDQFSSRLGLSYAISPLFSTSLGARFEGIPVKDLMGGNKGFRRPGNVLSLDPGLAYMANNLSINLNVPIALRRDRPQSVTDLETQMATGNPRNGDAAFADYAINLGITFRLPNKKEISTPDVQSPF